MRVYNMGNKHLVFGTATDFITGKTVLDTPDERIRQKIARFLVKDRGFAKKEIKTRIYLPIEVDNDLDGVTVDFTVVLDGRTMMVVMFGPGDIVSRQRPALAVARLLEPFIVPFAVISNGVDAYTMDSVSGKVTGQGLFSIPTKNSLLEAARSEQKQTITDSRRQKEARILFCMDVLTRRECDSFSCNRF